MEDLLVGTESRGITTDNTIEITGDMAYGVSELAAAELEASGNVLNNFAKAGEVLLADIETDKLAFESGDNSVETLAAGHESFKRVLDLTLNSTVKSEFDSVAAKRDLTKAFRVGQEAKESKFKEIIRMAKNFIVNLLNKIKELGKKLTASIRTIGMGAKKLKDAADALDSTDTVKISKDEDKSLHDKIVKRLGYYGDGVGVLAAFTKAGDAVIASYKEPTAALGMVRYEDMKTKSVADFVDSCKDAVTERIKKLPTDKVPVTSGIRKLAEGKDDMIGVTVLRTPKGYVVNALISTDKKKLVLKPKAAKFQAKLDAISYDEEIANDKIIATAKRAVELVEKYDPQDVITAVYERIRDVRTDISDDTAGGKAKYVTPALKFTAWQSRVASDATSALITNLKAVYDTAALLVKNAQ